MELLSVPVIDLACARCDLASEVDAALRRFGFFYVRSHGVAESLVHEQFEQSRRLFALPDETKRSLVFNATLDIGYTGGSGTAQALDATGRAAVDTKEGFMLTNNGVMDGSAPREEDPLAGATLRWPPGLPGYQRTLRRYFAGAYALNRRLNDLLFDALGMDAPTRAALGSAPFAVVKQLRYGPAATTANGSIGAGAHADWGSLTVLATDGTPGLQVELDGTWLPVPPKEGCLIVNAGDQIEMLTNGEYRSARHRVVTVSSAPRYSTAFFTYFNYRSKLAPLPRFVRPGRPLVRPPMDTREWFQYKLRQSVGEVVTSPVTTFAANAAANASGGAPSCAAPADGAASAAAVVRRIAGAPFGVEAIGVDVLRATDADIDGLMAALHDEGRGLLVLRGQALSPEALEAALHRLGSARGGFGAPTRYERWPGQSPGLRCCPHLSLLGNYRAREADELGTGAAAGDRIGEYKPARVELREWHTDGSFLPLPKTAIALYAPPLERVETCAPCSSGQRRSWWRRLLRWRCRARCRPAPTSALPPHGGETAFASGALALEQLGDTERLALDGVSAVHSWCDFMRFLEARDPARPMVTAAQCAAKPDVTWPLVRTHPLTGHKSLYLNPKNGLRVVSSADGANGAPPPPQLLDEIADFAGSDLVLNLTARMLASGVYEHAWRPGDLVLFDNRVLLHAATPFDAAAHERLIYRAEFPGEPVYRY